MDDGRGLLFDGRSDWSLTIVPTAPGDEGWRSAYDYDGGRWVGRDASGEEPFASVIAGVLSGWNPEHDEVASWSAAPCTSATVQCGWDCGRAR
ncbi:hypothetical protein V1634_26955 [Plantactinospora veratri]|uniref:Uncharacterized protein n=1 Tax=Plantactinospora veratri TaxID=1436122 RepID=A0ABU7SKM2_9ACTN